MNANLSQSSPYTLLNASPRSRMRAAEASSTSWAPMEDRFTSYRAWFRVMESGWLTRIQRSASWKDATFRPGKCPAVPGSIVLN